MSLDPSAQVATALALVGLLPVLWLVLRPLIVPLLQAAWMTYGGVHAGRANMQPAVEHIRRMPWRARVGGLVVTVSRRA
jgi:hypothetical protein